MSPRRAFLLLAAVTAGGCASKSGSDDSSPECTFEPGVYAAEVVNENADPTSFGVQSPLVLEIAADGGIAIAVDFVDERLSVDVTVVAHGEIDDGCEASAQGAVEENWCSVLVEVSDWAGDEGAGTVGAGCYVGASDSDSGTQDTFTTTWSVP